MMIFTRMTFTRTRIGAPALALGALLTFLVPTARAEVVSAQLKSGYIVRLSAPGSTVTSADLMVGTSSGVVSPVQFPPMPVRAADNLNLQSYFARNGTNDSKWSIDLGTWWNTNGSDADFFVFEVGGNDSIQVAPVFVGGAVGAPVSVSGWTPTGYTAVAGPSLGQEVHGLCFGFSDLRDASGAPLQPGQLLSGIQVHSKDIDGACFAAVDPYKDASPPTVNHERVYVTGPPRRWSPMEVTYVGRRRFTELDENPNPFLDLRLRVTFQGPGGESLVVPGFFAGSGPGSASGHLWKARFTPPSEGVWTAVASFREGAGAAIAASDLAGVPVDFDGALTTFDVGPVPASATGFHARGMLRYVGTHYLRFDDGGSFIKGGTNSPENLLAYFGFDGIADSGNQGVIHRYLPHRGDWNPGDPFWVGGTTGEDSRGLIGALNYLAGEGVNSVYMLPMNLGGDSQDVCPYVGQRNTGFDKLHFDISRLAQWNRAFQHAQRLGILLHFVLAETEVANELWLDGGTLGVQRKLFYRELVARFGHHNAIKWNLSEENDFPVQSLRNFADFLDELDAYDHPIAVHNKPNDLSQYGLIAGDPRFQATSAQFDPNAAGNQTEALRAMSSSAGHPWVVELDENGPADLGLSVSNAADLRRRVLWDVYFSGGAGIEWYFGTHPLPIGGDVTVEDLRTRQEMWDYMRAARGFVEKFLPFESMDPRDALLSGESSSFGGGEVFARAGQVYAVYLPVANPSGSLDLGEAPGISFTKRWFNPRANAFQGSPTTVVGGSLQPLGPPPNTPGEDWVVLLKRL